MLNAATKTRFQSCWPVFFHTDGLFVGHEPKNIHATGYRVNFFLKNLAKKSFSNTRGIPWLLANSILEENYTYNFKITCAKTKYYKWLDWDKNIIHKSREST